jgi:hypothetical protein
MTLFQILSVFFALFMSYVVRVHTQKTRISAVEASMWYSLWFLFAVIAVFPHILTGISEYFYFDRVFDLLVVGAFMVITFIVLRSYFMYRVLLGKIETLVRDKAIAENLFDNQRKLQDSKPSQKT